MEIYILGWGSVIWDKQKKFADFEANHDEWKLGGPELKLEFSRVSASRQKALTLVIDNRYGSFCSVAYAHSRRSNLDRAIKDLRIREGPTSKKKIGYVNMKSGKHNGRDLESVERIKGWAEHKGYDAVVWTDLDRNFEEESQNNMTWSLENAQIHLDGISLAGKLAAAEYVRKAPQFIKTNLRGALQKKGCIDHSFTHEEIAIAGYFIWENRTQKQGFDDRGHNAEDWDSAQKQLRETLAFN